MGGRREANLAHRPGKILSNVRRLSLSPAVRSLCLRSPDTFLFLPLPTAYREKSRGIKEAMRRFTAKVTTEYRSAGTRAIDSERGMEISP